MRSPGELIQDLDRYVRGLDTAGQELENALELLDQAEAAWEDVFDSFSEEIAEGGERMPGQERLVSMARAQSPQARDAWRTLRHAERVVKKLQGRQSRLKDQISGVQSQLSALKAEARAPEVRY